MLIRIILAFVILSSVATAGNDITITDATSGSPLPGATVRFTCFEGDCRGKVHTMKAKSDGSVSSPFPGKQEMLVKFIGYEEYVQEINRDAFPLLIKLKPTSLFMDEIVTTGQFVPRQVERSVYPIEVITRERIEAQSAVNLRDILQTQMNYRISSDSFLGSSLEINGVSGRNIKILINGVPVIGRVGGNIDLSQINLNNANKIEIIEGPMSSIYGSDALGGVINIITEDLVSDKLITNINSYYESIGSLNADAKFTYASGKNKAVLGFGRNFFAGFDKIDTSRSKQWKPKEQYFTDWELVRTFKGGRIRYSGEYFYEYLLNRGKLRSPGYISAFDDKYSTWRLSNALFYNRKIENNYIDVVASYSNYKRRKNTYFKDMTDLSEIPVQGSQDTSLFGSWMVRGSFSQEKTFDFMNWQTGFDVNIDDASGGRIEGNSKYFTNIALFGSAQLEAVDKFILQPSLRYIYNSEYDAPIIPSMHLKYSPKNNLSFRVSYSRGFRAPSLRELYFYFVDINHNIRGNEELGAERSHSFNYAMEWRRDSKYNVIKTETKLFYNDIEDLISLANIENTLYSYVNIGRYRTLGGDITVAYLNDDLTLKLGASYTGRSSRVIATSDNFRFSPEYTVNFLYNIPQTDLSVAMFYKHTGSRKAFSIDEIGETSEYEIEGYGMMDITLSYSLFDKKVQFNAGIKNLLDVIDINRSGGDIGGVHSSSSGSENIAWGRTFFLNLKYNFTKDL